MRTRLMRPFTVEGENGEVSYTKNEDFHKWGGFPNMEYTTREAYTETSIEKDDEFGDVFTVTGHKEKKVQWGWKDKGADGWAKSVLNKDTGLVNITPKFLGGAEKNIHTKDCMFSIENLAWQGYDPYSFERALSWEQRGPFGGRIMWFPPYGLRFNEDTSVNWTEHSFIGRGENVYTYTNTTRSGTLEFMMVVDHPSILDYSTWYGESQPDKLPKDTDVYRFFAGCDGGGVNGGSGNGGSGAGGGGGLSSFVKPTPLTDEYLQQDNTEAIPVTENQKPEPPTPIEKEEEPELPAPDEEIELAFYVFFPNNYSGYYDYKPGSKVHPIAYLLRGKGAQWNCKNDDFKQAEVLPITFKDISQSQFLGNGYEMSGGGITDESGNNYIIGTQPNWRYYQSSTYLPVKNKKWYYRTDGEYKVASGAEQYKNTFDQTLLTANSYKDMRSVGLNYNVEAVKGQFPEESDNENLYTLAEIAYALINNYDDESGETNDQATINAAAGNRIHKSDDRIKKLIEMLDTRDESIYKVIEINGIGYSNAHGNNNVSEINRNRNNFLAEQRCKTVIKWFLENYGNGNKSIQTGSELSAPGHSLDTQDLQDVSGNSAKKWRSAKITIKIKKSGIVEPKEMKQEPEVDETQAQQPEEVFSRFTDFKEVEIDTATGTQLYVNVNENNPEKKERRWYYDEDTKEMKLWDAEVEKTRRSSYNWKSKVGDGYNQTEENNTLRYDQEYHFFKQLEAKDPHVFDTLVKKLQYFDPAFHSMTPEGFMGRLNFLQQCTRQGNTISASDENGHSANNLAFGRPPFCILRLGDFYYQKIVIRNINITYDPLVLDLNNEGIGVVPLIANVTISFNFIGGGDLSGPVRRLQNAMSFNYYANGRLYDNRADRVEREKTNWETMGAMGHDKVQFDESYFHNVKMAK